MATLLKYENGLLLPVGKTSEVYKPVGSSGLGAESKSGVINILILVTVAINTLLTIAVAAKLS